MITKFAAGQTWTYATRPNETDSRLTIVGLDEDEEYGNIIHIFISGLAIPNPQAPEGKTTFIAHMPFVEESLEGCVGELESEANELPDYADGYRLWREAFEKGDAGVFDVPVKKAIEFVQESIV